ncbi:type VI secretion system baseplate subunit TssK [Alteromonas sp. a30]|uniref:type VI secretion system baseplate subunit TssK n=1 Tax=Alteromonas sp. a30 TaxID=2730917 RepID=UPI00227DB995|nr:type VI secretion system baseplate subunit TssK [Alteromonas sp. a30]MCY7293848.1 type VI secretion system baseplate subunit TssK [Alteromonas sp. a30]
MIDIQQLRNQVHWSEGMLLSAQHFQQNNLYFEQLMVYRDQLQNPYSWGVIHLDIDESAINRGKLEVTRLIAIMPDGTIVKDGTRHEEVLSEQEDGTRREEVLSEQDEPSKLLSLDLTKLNDIKEDKPFYVYLAIPQLTDACASDNETQAKRYDSVKVGNVIDQNDFGNRADIERLKPRVQLIPESQFNGKYSGFELAKIKLNDANFKLLPFIPAPLTLSQDSFAYYHLLIQKLDKMLKLINEKANKICNYFSDNDNNGVQRQRVYHLTAQLPAFNAVYLSKNVTPFALYQALVQMAGHMSPLTSNLIPPTFKTYDHNNPMQTFEPVIDYIEGICENIYFNFSEEHFVLDKQGTYFAPIQNLSKGNVIYISCTQANGSTIDKLKQWMESAMIASEASLQDAISMRSTGAGRNIQSTLDAFDLVAKKGELYCVINCDKDYIAPYQTLYIKGTNKTLEEHKPQRITLIADKRNG